MFKQGSKDLSHETLNQLIQCFSQDKAEDDECINNDVVFVRIPAFNDLATRQTTRCNTVLLGRKGDGKTTLLRRLAHDLRENGSKPNVERDLEVFKQINMEETYFTELINQFRQIAEAIHKHHPEIPDDQIATKLWTKYLMLMALSIACRKTLEMNEENELRDNIAELRELEKRVLQELSSNSLPITTAEISQGFLPYLYSILQRMSISDRCLAKGLTRQEEQNFDPMKAMQNLPAEFEKGAETISRRRLHVTIALDRFDNFVDRLVSNDLSITRLLRRQFLHGLITALYELQLNNAFNWLRIIASLPEDLVVDLDLREQATVQSRLFVRITWSLKDLRDMLDGRVSSVIPDTKWRDLFTFYVASSNKDVEKKELPGDYMIRHTTRRPRELMTQALKLFENLRETGKKIDSKLMNTVIAKTNQYIISSQVIPEWKSVLPNLSTIIARLHRSELKTVFSFQELIKTRVAPVLVTINKTKDRSSDEIKTFIALSSLFRVGMIGFRVKRGTPSDGYMRQGESDYVRYIFSYTASHVPILDVTGLLMNPELGAIVDQELGQAIRGYLIVGKEEQYELQLCFAPMFFESLDAKHNFKYIIDEIHDSEENA